MPLFELRLQGRVIGDWVEPILANHIRKKRFYQIRVWWDLSPKRDKITPITDEIASRMTDLLRAVCENIKIPAEGCGELAKRISVTLDHAAEELGNKRPEAAPTVEALLGYTAHSPEYGHPYRGEHLEGCGAVYYPEWP